MGNKLLCMEYMICILNHIEDIEASMFFTHNLKLKWNIEMRVTKFVHVVKLAEFEQDFVY